MRGPFLALHQENLAGVLPIKPLNVEALLWTVAPGVSKSQADLHSDSSNPPKLLCKCFNQFVAPLVSVQGSR